MSKYTVAIKQIVVEVVVISVVNVYPDHCGHRSGSETHRRSSSVIHLCGC
jgi:hypothetical protein